MRILTLGVSGDDVKKWQLFLRSYVKNDIVADGVFGDKTATATKLFQAKQKLTADGVVGQRTYLAAFKLGFLLIDGQLELGTTAPKKPANAHSLSAAERETLFGKFAYVAAPTAENPEAIKIIDGWEKNNIVYANIPQLAKLKGKSSYQVACHKLIKKQLIDLFQAWENHGVIGDVLTWNGLWVPRFKRGSHSDLSNHSWGSAFDINAKWNKLGHEPAGQGQTGCVYSLVEIAYEHGFYWGGWFQSRVDAMHAEAFKIL